MIRFFNRRAKAPSFEDVVSSIWMSRQDISPLVSLMHNLHDFKHVLRRQFGKYIQWLSEKVLIAKESIDMA